MNMKQDFRRYLAVVSLLICASLSAGTWYVSASADSGGDGLGWATAWCSLQRALEAASPGDKIWVASGTYYPEHVRETEGEAPYASSFVLKDGVSIYGGFKGTETAVSQREMASDGRYAWDFAHPTVLRQHDGAIGSVIITGNAALSSPTLLDGLVIENGNASGAGLDGAGGGLQGQGTLTVRNCLFRKNLARHGGGIHWNGPLALESSGLYDNDLVSEGWSGIGGGAALFGSGFCLKGIIICGNGNLSGGVQTGGGLYLSGSGSAIHCTIVDNSACRNASGLWADSGATVLNSIVWNNSGCQTQLISDDATVTSCAVEHQCATGTGNLPLLSTNCGERGCSANDNIVDGYYPCFVNPSQRDFRLGDGSYLLNRGQVFTDGNDALGQPLAMTYPMDIGACGSTLKGNLAIDFSVEYPFIYGGTSQVLAYFGLSTPVSTDSIFSADSRMAALAEESLHDWSATWLKTGTVPVTLTAEPQGSEQAYWNTAILTRSIQVRPRPIVIAADDIEHHINETLPELTWSIVAGHLVGTDSITGQLECNCTSTIGTSAPVTRGTLAIQDGNNGENYALTFLEGQVNVLKSLPVITLLSDTEVYNGLPQAPGIHTEPELDITVTYSGDDYGPTDVPPTDAGQYIVTIHGESDTHEGTVSLPFTIMPAPLTATADDKTRAYGLPNPPLTISYAGFQDDDSPADITAPGISTTATETSTVRRSGYPIVLNGGSARNYTLTLVNGLLTIAKAIPDIADGPTAKGITYGDALSLSTLTPSPEAVTQGIYQWTEPDILPDAGPLTAPWTFTPQDTVNYASVSGTADVMVNKRKAIVCAGTYTRPYGDKDPEFKPALAEDSLPLVPGDFLKGTLERTAGTQPGEYPITAKEIVISDNYSITFRPGTLSIIRRPVTITANDLTIISGQPEPALTWRVTEGSLVADDLPTGNLERETGARPGTYAIRQGTLALPDTYNMTFQEGTFTINQLILTADNATVHADSIIYGQHLSDSRLTGFVTHPATDSQIPGTFTWKTPDDAPKAGTVTPEWLFTPDNLEAANAFSGTTPLIVGKAPLVVSLVNPKPFRQYFCSDPAFTISYKGFVGTDDVSSLRLPPVARAEATLASIPGEYPITIGGGLDDNYTFTCGTGSLTIVPAQPAVYGTVIAATISYGQPLSESTLFGIFMQPENAIAVPGTLSWKTPDSTIPPTGSYSREWIFRPYSDYFTTVTGTASITVAPARLIITADSHDIMVNDPMPELTYTVTGLKAGEHLDDPAVLAQPPEISCDAADTRHDGTFAIRLKGGLSPNYELVLVNGTLTINLPPPLIHGMETVHVTYGDLLSPTEVAGQPSLPYSYACNIPHVFITNSLPLFNTYRASYFPMPEPGTYEPTFAFFSHPETGACISGTLTWEYCDLLLPVGAYEDFQWTFTPHKGQGVGPVTGLASVIVDKRPVRIQGPELTVGIGEAVSLDILSQWTYTLDDVVDEPVCDGWLHVATQLSNPTAGRYYYQTGFISLGDNYEPIIDPEGPCFIVSNGPIKLTVNSVFIEEGLLDPRTLSYTLTPYVSINTNGLLLEYTREPGTSVGRYRYTVTNLEYRDNPGFVVLDESKPGFLYICPSQYNIAVDSYIIEYGDPIPTPTYTTSNLPGSSVSGAPAYSGTPKYPGTYTIGVGTLAYSGIASRKPTIFGNGTLTIKKRKLVLSTGLTYKKTGTADPDVTYTIVEGSLVNGDKLTGALSREAGELPGTYRYTIGTLKDAHDCYEISLTENSQLIIGDEAAIQWDFSDIMPTSVIYGQATGESAINGVVKEAATGKTITGTWTWLTPGTAVLSEDQACMARFTPDSPLLPLPDALALSIPVKPRHLSILVHSHIIQWGEELPELTYELVSGSFHGSDHFTGELSAYAISEWLYGITRGTLDTSSGSYIIQFANTPDQPPSIIVRKRTMAVNVLNQQKAAGAHDPDSLFRITAGELETDDIITGMTISRQAGETNGEYAMAVTGLETALSPDLEHYDVIPVNGTLSISVPQEVRPSSQQNKIAVNAQWANNVSAADVVTWENEAFIFGVNAFCTLEDALKAVWDNGVILLAPGVYTAPAGSWNIGKSLLILGDDDGSRQQAVLKGTVNITTAPSAELCLFNLTMEAPNETAPAVRINEGTGQMQIRSCRIKATGDAIVIGKHNGVQLTGNQITSDKACIRCQAADGSAPEEPLLLYVNDCIGQSFLLNPGFPVNAAGNILNGLENAPETP